MSPVASQPCAAGRPATLPERGRGARRSGAGFLSTLLNWAGRRRSRIALDRLDRRLLEDVGLDVEAQVREARKPFWRA